MDLFDRPARVLLAISQAFDFQADALPANLRYVGPLLDQPSWSEPWRAPWSTKRGLPARPARFPDRGIKGDLQLWESEATDTAEDLFRQALDVAQRQGALSWELRAAVSLAKLLSDQARPGDALACLRPVYDRFSEGFETADLKAARALLDSLR